MRAVGLVILGILSCGLLIGVAEWIIRDAVSAANQTVVGVLEDIRDKLDELSEKLGGNEQD